MRFCLVALGSRGDVAPYLAVGRALRDRGHRVRVVVLSDYEALAAEAGVDVVPVAAGTTDAMWPDNPWLRRAALAQPGAMYALMRAGFARAGEPIARAIADGARGSDVVVAGTAARGAVKALCGATGLPHVTLLLAPLLPAGSPETGVLVPPMLGPVAGRLVSSALWRMTDGLGAGPRRAMSRLLHDEQGPGPRRRRGGPLREVVVCATSPTLAPQPRRPVAAGAVRVVRTGWIPSTPVAAATLDEGLASFLAERPDAVLMGFGSCPSASPAADLALFRRAAERCGRPLVVQTPLLPPGPADADLFNAPGADHRRLMPLVSAVVHHGGAGTTCTALASGTPSVVVPHLGDQGWFARRVGELGAGVAAPPRWRLGARSLANCVGRATAEPVIRRASEFAPVVAAEATGDQEVARALEELAGR